ncbi:MAG TPA: phosphoribosylaminoimidazolesuccinocarboxamide synthase [Alloiococcus sp.]|nr:phosphoribosylaminoimidazolesuccinocarboxamide synthase [Alloiococcus sp.]
MQLIYEGKTKDVYELDDHHVRLFFKDDMTGKDGKFDPGENQKGLTVEGAGQSGLALSTYFFHLLEDKGIKTHFVDANIEEHTMDVKKASYFGNGIEFICRFKSTGSFMRRYGDYAAEGQDIPGLVEITLKDDERGDPFISKQTLSVLNILNEQDYDDLVEQTTLISNLIKEELKQHDLELYDIKLEFGRAVETNELILIDEISGGNMRVYKDNQLIHPLDLNQYILEENN